MSLSDDQITTIVRWVDGGAPQGNPKDMPAPQAMAGRERMEGGEAVLGPPDFGDQVRAVHHGGAPSGRLVAAGLERFPLTEPRWVRAVEMRPGTRGGPQDHASCGRVSGAGRPRQRGPGSVDAELGASGDADGMGRRQRLRPLSSQHRQAAAAGIADFLGRAHPRRRAKRSATTSSWACGFIPKARNRNTELT